MDNCTPQQFAIVDQVLEARHSVIQTIEQPDVRCIEGIVGIHDKVLGNVLIIITKDGVGVCTPKGCQAVGPEFLERYKNILQSNKV